MTGRYDEFGWDAVAAGELRLWTTARAAVELPPVHRHQFGWRRSPWAAGLPVEVAYVRAGLARAGDGIALRNGHAPDGLAWLFTAAEWRAFTAAFRLGEWDDLTVTVGRQGPLPPERHLPTESPWDRVWERRDWTQSTQAGAGAVQVTDVPGYGGGVVGIRHAAATDSPVLLFPAHEWVALGFAVRRGHFDDLLPPPAIRTVGAIRRSAS